MNDEDRQTLDALNDKRNASQRAFYATPTQELKAIFLEISAEYQRVRLQLDPEFRNSRIAANKRAIEKKKLAALSAPK